MAILPRDHILRLHAATLAAHLTESRVALLGGIDTAFVASLPTASDPSAQMLSDLHRLNATKQLNDGTVPLQTWLENAVALAGQRIEAGVFREAIEAIHESISSDYLNIVEAKHAQVRDTARKEDTSPTSRLHSVTRAGMADAKAIGPQPSRNITSTSRNVAKPMLLADVSPPKVEFTDRRERMRRLPESFMSGSALGSTDDKNFGLTEHTLQSLEGVWRDSRTGTTSYIMFCGDGKLYCVYCYGGSDNATGEYYDWELVDKIAIGRYRRFNDDASGYAYLYVETKDRLVGGWCPSSAIDAILFKKLSDDVSLIEKLSKVSVAMTWIRQPNSLVIPDSVEKAFRRLLTERKK